MGMGLGIHVHDMVNTNFARIPMAAIHIYTSSVQVLLALMRVVSAREPFLGNPYK